MALGGLIATAPIVAIAGLAIRLESEGPAIFAQTRVGRDEQPFTCFKLRTMRKGTVAAATHEVSAAAVTRLGSVLRRIKVDELPQLWNVIKGEMSLVGPRPCLPQQAELIARRREHAVFALRPGITGPGQAGGVDMSEPARLAAIDATYRDDDPGQYLRLLLATVAGSGFGDRVRAAPDPGV